MALRVRNGYRRKTRNAGNRQRKAIILLAMEGKNQTETIYFREMAKAYGCVLKFVPGNYTDPANMAKETKKSCESFELDPALGDCAYCLVDADFESSKNRQIAEADKTARHGGFQVIVSAPCFEIWFLCHFRYSGRQYTSSDEVLAELREYMPGYSKSVAGVFGKTADCVDTAITNAKRLECACAQADRELHTVAFSPSTEVYKVVEAIRLHVVEPRSEI